MGNKELKRIVINDGDKLPFEWRHDNYGRAEFEICSVYKNGNLKEIFIYPRQQANVDYYYYWSCEYNRKRDVTYQGYENLDEPKVWRTYFCKEHKTICVELYVPRESKYLWFGVYSDTVTIGFLKTKH